MTADRARLSRRQRRLTALVAAPAVVIALGLCAIEVWRVVRPRSPLFAAPFAYSLAEAIETGNVPHAYQYIRAGQDPNQRIAVRHPVLTHDRWVLATPLLWATATGQTDAVKMLLGYGARLDRPADRQAACLADALRHSDIARMLRTYGGVNSAVSCADLASSEAPLLRALTGADPAER